MATTKQPYRAIRLSQARLAAEIIYWLTAYGVSSSVSATEDSFGQVRAKTLLVSAGAIPLSAALMTELVKTAELYKDVITEFSSRGGVMTIILARPKESEE